MTLTWDEPVTAAVTFSTQHGSYYTGEVAAFLEADAQALVDAGVADAVVAPGAAKEPEPEPQPEPQPDPPPAPPPHPPAAPASRAHKGGA
jgi:outer membrane biosynthesis protein TonB